MHKEQALITGASGGIGLELAGIMAKAGHDLILIARNKNALDDLANTLREKHKVKVTVIAKDLSQAQAPKELYKEISAANLTVNILVNNAGFGDSGLFADADEHSTMDMLHVNMQALTRLTRLFLPAMLARKSGRLMNVASTAAFTPTPTMAVYCATKAYILSFTEALSEELRGTGVTATVLCPGVTSTGFAKRADTEAAFFIRLYSMRADTVARQGYKAMMKGKRRIITGVFNKFMVLFTVLTPNGLLVKLGRRMMSKNK
ncbi:SDR family oxidoreductase [bacterium]|nr:SDR family oxidoreductase [bacterium]